MAQMLRQSYPVTLSVGRPKTNVDPTADLRPDGDSHELTDGDAIKGPSTFINRNGQANASQFISANADSPAAGAKSTESLTAGSHDGGPPRPQNPRLTVWDVASLIINKMIGTGIFVNPPPVALLAGSKGLALSLWIIGFVYTLLRYVVDPP